MKVVILAGGLGTRLSEETSVIPKPMVRIGGHPIIWHIMKIYSTQGYNDFIICLGHKGEVIKNYFLNLANTSSDFTVDISSNKVYFNKGKTLDWKVTMVETGELTMTGGRMKRISKHINDDEFLMTYGDGLSDINIDNLIKFHKNHGKKATVTAVKPPPRFGTLNIGENSEVEIFEEKTYHPWINGGFFALSKDVLDYIEEDSTPFEGEPMKRLAEEGELFAYKHNGFWRCMDTLSDKNSLEELWIKNPQWKIWKD